MAYEIGGRADKYGNQFEYNWTIYKLLEVIEEKIDYIILENIGECEEGVDLWIGNKDGSCEGQQCKGRNGSQESWDYGTVNAKGIFAKWKNQLEREENNNVSLVSPVAFTLFEDLTRRARNTNTNPDDFYQYQIEGSGKETRIFFKSYCKAMEIEYTSKEQLVLVIDYLSRTFYRQVGDSELKNIILSKIYLLFHGNSEEIYSKLLSFVLTTDILGKRVDILFVNNYLKVMKIEYRKLAKDSRILPKIEELNQEYRNSFIPLKNGILERMEFLTCQKAINEDKSIIIHGVAGIGKSGCTENIIQYCEQFSIAYLAVKLDKRIPSETSEKWGNSMGLPASPVHCLNAISKNKKAVLILDQLDALRWTQAHSGVSLDVCFQTIRELESLNIDREEKITIVMVSRTYDLQNDQGIKNLFRKSEKDEIEWVKIQVKDLTEDNVKCIVGEWYDKFSKKMKDLLSIPSNLYIWQQLELQENYTNIDTTRQLINEWWNQLQKKAEKNSLSATELNKFKNKFVEFCDKRGRINAPLALLQVPVSYVDFFQSNGFMVVVNNLLSFIHQSILDCFLSEYMLAEYYEEKNIEEIIGDISKQKPGRRYQVQLFMQQLLESSEQDFLNAGNAIIKSKNIRFNLKYVFLEVLSVIETPSEFILQYVIGQLMDKNWGKHIENNVIKGRSKYVNALQKQGILDEWIMQSEKKATVMELLASVSHDLSSKNVEFIAKYSFLNEEDDKIWSRCFDWHINEESDEFFELRLKYYEKYPELLNQYLDIKDMLQRCEMRTIRILALMLKAKNRKNSSNLYRYEEEFILEDSEIIVEHYTEINDLILPLLPSKDERMEYSEWSGGYTYKTGIERVCVQILKKANAIFAKKDSQKFLCRYESFKFIGNSLYNEILLEALYYLPDEYADEIVQYLCEDLNKTLFEGTSGNGNKILSGKRLICKISKVCSQEKYLLLESKIEYFLALDAKDRLHRRISFNQEKNGNHVYWRFWGDFQKECLESLPLDRLTNKAKNMLMVLTRSIGDNFSIYDYSEGHSGSVSSPVSGKTLSLAAWKSILTNNKIPDKEPRRWREIKGGFIESTKSEFARSFEKIVSENPVEVLEFILSQNDFISYIYIDRLFSGIAYSLKLDEINVLLIEKMFNQYRYDYKNYRAITICRIIEKKKNARWNRATLDIVKDIALNHENPSIENPSIISYDDKEMNNVDSLESNAINSARSEAACVIGQLLWDNNELYDFFKDAIEALVNDINPVVQYASMFALWPIYNIDKDWAIQNILKLYAKDYRMAGFYDSKSMFFLLYDEYKEVIMKVITECFQSDDKRLLKVGGYSIAEMYMQYNEFDKEINNSQSLHKGQKESIIEMLIIYFGIPKYNEKAKNALRLFFDENNDLEFPWTRLFYESKIELDRDKDFVIELLTSKIGRKIIHAFVHFLEEGNKSLVDYSDIIIKMCKQLLTDDSGERESVWGIQDELSKLTIALYDDTCNLTLDQYQQIAIQCLDIWDGMFERQIGSARLLTSKMMDL
jgi:hypothetical protein